MELIARFDRGHREEIRACLVNRDGEVYLDLRVYRKPAAGEGEPSPSHEGISVPLGLFSKLVRAVQAVEEAVGRRNLLPREAPSIMQMVGGEPTVVPAPRPVGPTFGRTELGHLGRNELRLQLDCPVDYVIRGRLRPQQEVARRRGRTKDINRTGAQVVLPERVPVLTNLHVTMHLPVGVVALPCEVVWAQHSAAVDIAREGCRHGLRFIEVGAAENGLLVRLVGEAAQQASSPSA